MLLLDGNSLMHRAYHALPAMTSENGEPTGALHGFLMMLLKALEEEKPDLCAVAFDLHGPTFRHLKYDAYKAGRAPTPDDLRAQFETVCALLDGMHIRRVTLEGYEADDLLGTLSQRCEEEGVDCLIVTGDRDAFQLAGEHTTVLYTRQGLSDILRVTPQYLMDTYGVTPSQFIDMKGLMGDSSDNIPGVAGVGEKTAQKLIAKYGTLDKVLETADAEQKGKLRERLLEGAESARFSRWLATIDRHAPLSVAPEDCAIGHLTDAIPLLRRLSLKSAEQKLVALCGEETAPAEAPEKEEKTVEASMIEARSLDEFLNALEGRRVLALSLERNLLSAALSEAEGVSLPLGAGESLLDAGVGAQEALSGLKTRDFGTQEATVYDVKGLLSRGAAFSARPFDVMLAAYCLNPGLRSYALEALCGQAGVPFEARCPALSVYALGERQRAQLEKDGLRRLFDEIEMPLAFVLRDMEQLGFLTDSESLIALGKQFDEKVEQLTGQIREIAGEGFNVNSPKQLGALLFDKLGLKGGKKTKTGYSTSADVLEGLAGAHPIIPMILEYRKYAKLKSTYVEALLRLRGADGRIHTCFDQVGTITGRISSAEPNLQNIPVRTALGREIRRSFVAKEGCLLVDADYSQIELRVLAHMSGDEVMREAFLLGQDIHARTAAEVYGVPIEFVTPEMRLSAKAVNFGIVYGISDFGLAKNLGVSRAEAAGFIERYFLRYPAVKRFMDACVAQGKTEGYVTTLMGRRRYLPELSDKSYAIRQFGERAAMNSPIQGTAADIIKLAMIRVHDELLARGLQARLILQVHDELIVETPEDEVETVKALVSECMAGVMQLSVPLLATVSVGKTWYECK
ncbi:MAG: DNA polymerase I [bacterium]|nr:DNA polymerase I [bacterium]